MIGFVDIDTIKKEVSMINRIVIMLLCGFLVFSLSFNAIQSEELAETKRQSEFDNYHYSRIVTLAHEREPD
jgi:hypothetical protein